MMTFIGIGSHADNGRSIAELDALADPTGTIAVHRAELFVPARRVGPIRLPAIGMGLVQHDRDAQAASAPVEEDHLTRRAHGPSRER